MSAYCEAADLYDYGLPRGALPNPGREVASVDAAANTLTLQSHGFRDDQLLKFRAAGGGTLPGGLSAGTTYYAIVVDDDTFQVSASEGGSAVDLSSAGSGVIVTTPLPFAAKIAQASALIDNMLTAHVTPLEAPYPTIIVAATAQLAAHLMLASTGGTSESFAELIKSVQAMLSRWEKGKPVQGDNGPPPAANLAVASSGSVSDPRGWTPSGGDTLP